MTVHNAVGLMSLGTTSSKRGAPIATDSAASTPSDEMLVKAMRQRDTQAFEQLYDRYSGLIFAVCMRVLRNPVDAEDALIETFWTLWQKPDRFDERRGSLATYLAMQARCRSIDLKRSRFGRCESRRAETAPLSTRMEQVLASDDSPPIDDALQDERRTSIRRALESLTPPQREAIELAFYDGLSHREIAQRLRTPLGTVKTRIRSGLIQLREVFRT